MQKVLLIEDELDIHLIVRALIGQRCQLLLAPTIEEAAKSLERHAVDLVLLDVNLPDGDGFRLFPNLKSSPRLKDVPIIFLTGKSGVSDRVAGFSLGADDYIVKPFEPLEFRARVEAKLAARMSRKNDRDVIAKGRLELDRDMFKAFALNTDGIPHDLDLTPNEFRLLIYLLIHEGHVLSRDRLMTAVWGEDIHVLERSVDRHISSLRRKLDPQFEVIEPVPGVGYRFKILKTPA